MNDYLSKTEISPVDRPKGVPAVSAAPSVAVRPDDGNAAASRGRAPVLPPADGMAVDEEVASAAEYARIHAEIADIMAHVRGNAQVTVDEAASEIQSMLPTPIVIVPLPPASKEAVESTVSLARRMAEQSLYAHAAQAHMKRGTVDQILSTAV
ncbi:hypothetical protein [Sphingobium cloacae]|uniref:Uncharacterized protein n=1 Tax=Sphingobium cloacae TaxID=120107 RepID=A0A1E1F2A4_9SPHN|nr:hypothetical protein [Sphingobium cloacae]BAV64646.1 hypothetical protein SCLO_1016060 [Sphingobium cloacae]